MNDFNCYLMTLNDCNKCHIDLMLPATIERTQVFMSIARYIFPILANLDFLEGVY